MTGNEAITKQSGAGFTGDVQRDARRRIFICVQGLHVKGDSIGFDAVYQWKFFTALYRGRVEVRLFCEKFDADLYPGIPIEASENFFQAIDTNLDAIVIYHFCDGWAALDDWLSVEGAANVIIRWHNNTPPWFIAKYADNYLDRTVQGYQAIIRLAHQTNCRFWCNSEFTARQLNVMGVRRDRADVVYPGSYCLDRPPANAKLPRNSGALKRILFVSRIVPHKGHKQIILTAAYAKHCLNIPTMVQFPGRVDMGFRAYRDELIELAKTVDVELDFSGEVDRERLRELYANADIFLCLSEHEGFGLPVFEAMRSGLPVLAWLATATAESMSGHPLSATDLSARWFAAALATLEIPEIKNYVVQWQNAHLTPRYTNERISSQIVAALKTYELPAVKPELHEMPTDTIEFSDRRIEGMIRDKIAQCLLRIGNTVLASEDAMLPREIQNNFVTLYDIETYNALCNTDAPVAISDKRPSAITFLPPRRFLSGPGRIRNGNYICPLPSEKTHLIYGPYMPLEKGIYKVEFLFEVNDVADDSEGRLVFDVAAGSAGRRIRSQRRVRFRDIARRTPVVLRFVHRNPPALVEFRIAAKSFTAGSLTFRGAILISIGPTAIRRLGRACKKWMGAKSMRDENT